MATTCKATLSDPSKGSLTDLILQGGWNGSTGSSYALLSGGSTFNVPLEIVNWNGNVTLSDITISGSNSVGLTVITIGTGNNNIALHNVKSNKNASEGAFLDNNAGTGSIIIDSDSNGSSEFNNNTNADGLDIHSNGNITLTDVTADGNYGGGASLNNDTSFPAATGAINISDSDFSNNGSSSVSNDTLGLEAISNGSITLTDVTADDNVFGAYLDNCLDRGGGSCTNSSSNNGISVDNSGISGGDGFNGNDGNGLEAYSNENVTLTKVTADGNLYDGALLGYYNYDIPLSDEIGGNVIVTGGDFSDNNSGLSNTDWPSGLEVHAHGSITLTGVTADDNIFGAYLDNCLWNDLSVQCTGTGSSSITVDNTSGGEFNDNNNVHLGGDGLDALSLGTIALTGVTADDNYNNDAYLVNAYPGATGNIEVDNDTFDFLGVLVSQPIPMKLLPLPV